MAKSMIQHQPLRKPMGWKDQEASLVMQIDRLFDEVYQKIAQLQEAQRSLENRVSELEEE